MNLSRVLLAAVCAALSGSAAMAADPVRVEGGLVKGTVEDGLAVYRGIPFAAPPVGDLRWCASGRNQPEARSQVPEIR